MRKKIWFELPCPARTLIAIWCYRSNRDCYIYTIKETRITIDQYILLYIHYKWVKDCYIWHYIKGSRYISVRHYYFTSYIPIWCKFCLLIEGLSYRYFLYFLLIKGTYSDK